MKGFDPKEIVPLCASICKFIYQEEGNQELHDACTLGCRILKGVNHPNTFTEPLGVPSGTSLNDAESDINACINKCGGFNCVMRCIFHDWPK